VMVMLPQLGHQHLACEDEVGIKKILFLILVTRF